jgi:hypothetical protein
MIFLGLEKQVNADTCNSFALRTCGDPHEPYGFYFFPLSNDIWVQLGHIQVNLIRSAHNSIRFIINLYYRDVLDTYPVYFGQMFLVFTPSGGLLQ